MRRDLQAECSKIVGAAEGHEALCGLTDSSAARVMPGVAMLGIDGFEAPQVVRRRIPAFVLTVTTKEPDSAMCRTVGADGLGRPAGIFRMPPPHPGWGMMSLEVMSDVV